MGASPTPDFRLLLPDPRHPTSAEYSENWNLRAYQTLLHAEAFRLSGQIEEAHRRFQTLAQQCVTSGHQIEAAHAWLGVAESQRLMGQTSRSAAQTALALYEKTQVAWGQVHAHLSLALFEAGDSGLAAQHIQSAYLLAKRSGLKFELEFIQSLREATSQQRKHVLLFM